MLTMKRMVFIFSEIGNFQFCVCMVLVYAAGLVVQQDTCL